MDKQQISPQRVRELMQQVQNCTVEGVVAVTRTREGYEPIAPEELRARTHARHGVTVTSSANWLAHRLLREAFPPELTPALNAHGITLPFFHAHYHTPGICRPLSGSAVEKLSGLAADDGALRTELAQQLAAAPSISAVAFQKKYLQVPSKALAEAVAVQRAVMPLGMDAWDDAEPYLRTLQSALRQLRVDPYALHVAMDAKRTRHEPEMSEKLLAQIIAGEAAMPGHGFALMLRVVKWYHGYHGECGKPTMDDATMQQLVKLTRSAKDYQSQCTAASR